MLLYDLLREFTCFLLLDLEVEMASVVGAILATTTTMKFSLISF